VEIGLTPWIEVAMSWAVETIPAALSPSRGQPSPPSMTKPYAAAQTNEPKRIAEITSMLILMPVDLTLIYGPMAWIDWTTISIWPITTKFSYDFRVHVVRRESDGT
jgi:hypothetical protein